MEGNLSWPATALMASAILSAWASLSITHGPAIRNRPEPTCTPPISNLCSADTTVMIGALSEKSKRRFTPMAFAGTCSPDTFQPADGVRTYNRADEFFTRHGAFHASPGATRPSP